MVLTDLTVLFIARTSGMAGDAALDVRLENWKAMWNCVRDVGLT